MGRQRLLGAVIGFIGGAAIGLGAMFYLYGAIVQEPVGWVPRITAALIVGVIGAFLGALSGLSRG